MPTPSTTLAKNMLLKAQFGHKSRPAGGNFGLVLTYGAAWAAHADGRIVA